MFGGRCLNVLLPESATDGHPRTEVSITYEDLERHSLQVNRKFKEPSASLCKCRWWKF